MQQKKITFIGAGNMAFALISGLINSGYPAELISAVNKNNLARREQLRQMGIQVDLTLYQAIAKADVVILAVKPQIMAEVCTAFSELNFQDKWLISVAAGISLQRLSEFVPTATTIIRAMPNTPALIGEGITGLFAKKGQDLTACQFAEKLFSAVGHCYWLENEAQLNQIIAITGSSPAYFFAFVEAIQQSAIQLGFAELQAREFVQNVALGAAKMVVANPERAIATLRENVTSKGGTTAQALAVFEHSQLNRIVANAMNAVIQRAEEMERSL